MAALNIAFESPDNSRGAAPSRERAIDLVHLGKQTMGDKALEVEVLQMFARQARSCLQEIGSGDPKRVEAASHKLRGAASAVGAFRVADAAGALESNVGDAAHMAAVTTSVIEAENFILKLSR
ncbi:transcriptional regulator [Rhizobium dioscoreae]|uniref:Transcriptional regulator n=1 Tax=Rhizobium dioscoreae TaxID=2653122 RepID=A0ABQ0YZ16_9HYPH|nr:MULTISPECIES: Hpt domain-containing protein [Rhizobium]MCZ3378850.1 Hpt domain-containing protein [Rhizobium sp. AG207R]GES44993.1 transcriptional regulator [Rhizobium dioscoreae]GES48525.1 transcriptional regulator [Rhizobium dioscoreae]GLU79005.1 transcriptional regulator [Rhizobium sp. NBRC 114257]